MYSVPNNLGRKAAVLIGLSIFMSGVCDANAATITETATFDLAAPFKNPDRFTPPPLINVATETLVFSAFNPSLGTLTGVEFSLDSSLSSPFCAGFIYCEDNISRSASVAVQGATNLQQGAAFGSFNFADVSGLYDGLTTANYTGQGTFIDVVVTLSAILLGDEEQRADLVAWIADQTGQGLTLTYTYTPAATPLPASLPLFAAGLGGLGLFGWRRKRKARALA